MEILGDQKHIVFDGSPDSLTGREWGEFLPVVQYTNAAFPIHLPDGSTFSVFSAKYFSYLFTIHMISHSSVKLITTVMLVRLHGQPVHRHNYTLSQSAHSDLYYPRRLRCGRQLRRQMSLRSRRRWPPPVQL